MEYIFLVWALIATYYAYKYYKLAVIGNFISGCLFAAGTLTAGSEKFVHMYFKVLANEPDGVSPVRRVYANLRKQHGLSRPKYWYEDTEKIEKATLQHIKSIEPELVERSKNYE